MTEFALGVLMAIPVGWLVFGYGMLAFLHFREISQARPADIGGWVAYLLMLWFFIGCVVAAGAFASAFFHTASRAAGAAVTLCGIWIWIKERDSTVTASKVPSKVQEQGEGPVPNGTADESARAGTDVRRPIQPYWGPERFCGSCMKLVVPKSGLFTDRCPTCQSKL